MITQDTRKQAVAIVDGFTASGLALATRFRMQGIACIEVLSQREFPQKYLTKTHARDTLPDPLYAGRLVFDGDYDALVRSLYRYDIIGIIPGSGTGVPLADALSERMDLHSNGTRRSEARRDRFQMQHALIDAGVPVKQFICTADEVDLIAWYRSGRFYDVVVKPMSSFSPNGVTFCRSEEDALHAFRDLIGTTNALDETNAEVLIEERLFGTEFRVNTVSWDGRHRVAEIWHSLKGKRAGVAGPVLPDDRLQDLIRYTFSCLDALGIRYGAAHTTIVMTGDGPLMAECGAWVMGGTIPTDLILSCPGACQVDLMVGAYCDPGRFLSEIDTPLPPLSAYGTDAPCRTA